MKQKECYIATIPEDKKFCLTVDGIPCIFESYDAYSYFAKHYKELGYIRFY